MNLLEFATRFKNDYTKRQDSCEENIDQDAIETEAPKKGRLITLTDNTKMSVRNVLAVVRVPYFVAETDPENYFHSLLRKYKPFTNEIELLKS
ncbi:hypothetical protein AVEN_98464-1 [Araneus ventricosus]|uniref:Uncharacterized protein n=1 Tax=Araneus ventricosus TaxID=182803 RepID=A0A4Y1ZX10_ARAVE|nr:hypothetical protein AVEN_98464-1 [Araneus ventricosus]